MTNAPSVLIALATHVLLTLLPIFAGLLIATKFGVKDRLLLLSIGLCSLMVTGYLTFWIFWASAAAGRIFAILLTPALVVAVIWLGVPRLMVLKELCSEFWQPILLWVASSLLIFSFGAMYTSSPQLNTTAQSRLVSGLPIDNEIDLILAKALQSSHRPLARPLYVIWDSSDRPPLQAGVYLSQEAILPGADTQAVHYVVVGVLLQGLWIFGIWGLLAAVRVRARLLALVLTAILFSGFVVVNTFFTWPKLFAAAYLALLVGILFTPGFKQMRGSAVAGGTAGALAGASLLAHGGSVLALLAFVVVMAIQRRWATWRFILSAIAALALTQGSWMVYQRVIDPPGDQLLRLQIANQIRLPGERGPLLKVIIDAYERKSTATIVSNKVSNLDTPFTHLPTYVVDTTRLIESYFLGGKHGATIRSEAAGGLITLNFFYLLPSIGFLSLGFFAWAAVAIRGFRRRAPPAMQLAGTIWLFLIVNIGTWALILFGPSATVIHQGTYVTELLAYSACVIGLWMLSPRLCTSLVILQASLAVILYGFNTPSSTVPHHLNTQLLVLAAVGMVATVASLSLVATRRRGDIDDDTADAEMKDDRTLETSDEGLLATSPSTAGAASHFVADVTRKGSKHGAFLLPGLSGNP